MATIDHLVYAVPNLEKGIAKLEKKLGVQAIVGGKHLTKGTHNALINLGNQSYLEVIAVDPDNQIIKEPRWMGVDTDLVGGKLTRWALKSSEIAEQVEFLYQINPNLAKVEQGSRKKEDGTMLKWQLSLPLAHPQVEITPFLIDWADSIHPCSSLTQACSLIKLEATHPTPQDYRNLLSALNFPLSIEKSDEVSLIATIETPNGFLKLS